MALQPRKTKYRKMQKGRTKGITSKGSTIAFGSFGLKALGAKWITGNQIEASRKVLTREMKRKGTVWIRIFPYKPITQKGAETPMGGGKGSISGYVFPIEPGRIMFEIDGVEQAVAVSALKKAAQKLPIKTRIVSV